MESTYDRIHFGLFEKTLSEQEILRLCKLIRQGNSFLKYCRNSPPKQRLVFMEDDRIFWCDFMV